ncbi:MAG TPA: hypothetical protein VN457_01870 [Chlamydiales bacterium]|nr:hypothetical protein [Chlamydiales bacterium]
MIEKLRSSCLFLFLLLPALCIAEEKKTEPTPPEVEVPQKSEVITADHTLQLGTKTISYQSLTGFLPLTMDGQEKAQVFFTAYFAKDADPHTRPITFCFNGGPGCASIWLHIGALGPKRAHVKDLIMNPSPCRYETNPYTLLQTSDLVFVDPVSTGFSHPKPGVDAKQFYGVDEDIASMSEFVRYFLTYYDRWNSPKFLLGESYGTLRVVGIAEKLYTDHFLATNGLILISSCLDFHTQDTNCNDLGQILSLPSLAATAWYHKKLAPEMQAKPLKELITEVEKFSIHEYAHALFQGDTLPEAKKIEVATQLSNYTGLAPAYISRMQLRLQNGAFMKELLKNDFKVLGRFDGRYTGYVFDPEARAPLFDPSLDAVASAFISAFQEYLDQDLHWKSTAPYKMLNHEVHPWNYGMKQLPAGMGYVSVTEHLRTSAIQNPNLRIYVASGYYDLALPYFSTTYTLNHLQLPEPLRKQVTHSLFEAGHMMYLQEASLVRLSQELQDFIQSK